MPSKAVLKRQALIEGLKEFGRVVVIAAVSAGIVAAQAAAGLIQDPIANIILITMLTSIGKAWDKKVHEDETDARTGVVPF